MKTSISKACLAMMGLAMASQVWAQLEVNQAREMDLDGLSGLGPATTRQILSERQLQPFRDWPDLLRRVSGIGPKKAVQLSTQGLQVNGEAYVPPSPAKTGRKTH